MDEAPPLIIAYLLVQLDGTIVLLIRVWNDCDMRISLQRLYELAARQSDVFAEPAAEAEKLNHNELARDDRRRPDLPIEVTGTNVVWVSLIEQCHPEPCIGKIGHSIN